MTRVVLSSASELEDERWRAVEERSQRDDGRFIFAVRTTGIYCRPRARRDERAVRMSSFSATHKARATPDTARVVDACPTLLSVE